MSAARGRGATTGPTRVILGIGLLLVVVYGALGIRAWLRNQQTLGRIEELRQEMLTARVTADSCQGDLAVAESRFRQKDAEVDSLRREVEAAERRQPDGSRGVDAREYDAYLETFEAYNAAVSDWEARASGIREMEERCTQLILRHNLLADSLRRAVEAAGIEM